MNHSRLALSDAEVIGFQHDHPEVFKGAHHQEPDLGVTGIAHNVGVHIAKPQGEALDDVAIIAPRSYEAMLDSFYMQGRYGVEASRDQVLANTTGRTVIGVDTPGFAVNPGVSMSALQMFQGARGNLKPIAEAQLRAILEFTQAHQVSLDRIHMLGYSMAAAAVVGMTEVLPEMLPKTQIADITLFEPANDYGRAMFGDQGLQAHIQRETNADNTLRYLRLSVAERDNALKISFDRDPENEDLALDPERQAIFAAAQKRGQMGNVALGFGLRVGFTTKKKKWYHTQDSAVTPPFRIIRTDGSEIARLQANQKTVESIGEYTQSRLITISNPEHPHHHPIWQSLGAVASIFHAVNTNPTH